MQTITLLSRKGGSGKSTLAIHWAVEAQRTTNSRVVLIDLDPQGSCSRWYQKREAASPLLLQSSPSDLPGHLEACKADGVNLVLIDTVPDINHVAVVAARYSDLIIIPARPSVLDLESIGGSVELVEGLGKRAVIVLNQTHSTSSDTLAASKALGGYSLPVCPVSVAQRLVFSRSLIDGRTAIEIEPRGKAAKEIRQSWGWIQTQRIDA